MYVQWLLEFLWRIFIQGPLLLIKFLTGDNFTNGALFNFYVNDKPGNEHYWSYLSLPLYTGIAMLLLFICFVLRIAMLTIRANGYTSKKDFADAFKRLLIFSAITFCLSIAISLVLAAMDAINNSITDIFLKSKKINQDMKVHDFSSYVYFCIFNGSLSWTEVSADGVKDFFNPDRFQITSGLKPGDKINFIVAIMFVLTISCFLMWMIWTIFQKSLEIIFLSFGLPFTMSFSQTDETSMRWKIWVNEIFNKIIIFFVLLVMYRFFLFLFIDTYNLVWSSSGSIPLPINSISPAIDIPIIGGDDVPSIKDSHSNILYIMWIVVLANGSAIIFFTKYIASKNYEHIGFFQMVKSFKQTRTFMETYREDNINSLSDAEYQERYQLQKINDNISSLRESIVTNIRNKNSYESIEMIKVFNR